MKKLISFTIIILLMLSFVFSCNIFDTDTNTDEGEDTPKLYSQINGGEFLGKLDDSIFSVGDVITVRDSPYRLISTYEELMELSENASKIDSSIFEENVILYVRQQYGELSGEAVGYSDLKMENGELFITYSKYEYWSGAVSECIVWYKDYIVIPKNEIPQEIPQSGKIGVIMNEIKLARPNGANIVDELSVPLNTVWFFETADEKKEFKSTYNVSEESHFHTADEKGIAIYVKRPTKYEGSYAHKGYQGYLPVKEDNVLKITYLYDENLIAETEYYIDFICIPVEMFEGVEKIEVDVKARQNPAFPEGEYSSWP